MSEEPQSLRQDLLLKRSRTATSSAHNTSALNIFTVEVNSEDDQSPLNTPPPSPTRPTRSRMA